MSEDEEGDIRFVPREIMTQPLVRREVDDIERFGGWVLTGIRHEASSMQHGVHAACRPTTRPGAWLHTRPGAWLQQPTILFFVKPHRSRFPFVSLLRSSRNVPLFVLLALLSTPPPLYFLEPYALLLRSSSTRSPHPLLLSAFPPPTVIVRLPPPCHACLSSFRVVCVVLQ